MKFREYIKESTFDQDAYNFENAMEWFWDTVEDNPSEREIIKAEEQIRKWMEPKMGKVGNNYMKAMRVLAAMSKEKVKGKWKTKFAEFASKKENREEFAIQLVT